MHIKTALQWHGVTPVHFVKTAFFIVKSKLHDNQIHARRMLGLSPVCPQIAETLTQRTRWRTHATAPLLGLHFCMHGDSQLFIPDSFLAIYMDRRQRLQTALAQVAARYELCEDMAQMLVEQAQILYHQSAPSEAAILKSMYWGLSGTTADNADRPADDAVLAPPEARWVVLRLSELLQWQAPELPLPASGD